MKSAAQVHQQPARLKRWGTFQSEAQLSQPWMVIRAAPKRPMELPVFGLDRPVIDARVAMRHQALGIELPVLIAVAAEPVAGVVVPLVHKPYRDAMAVEGPKLLDQAVVKLLGPLALQQGLRLSAALRELCPVAPDRVRAVGEHDACRVAAVPAVFGQADLLDGRVAGEWRQRRAGVHGGVLQRDGHEVPQSSGM